MLTNKMHISNSKIREKVCNNFASVSVVLASCLINAQPLPAHSPAADDNLIGCTSHDLTDDWSLAITHFSGRLGAFFYWTRCCENNVPFDNTTPIYL